MSSRYLIPSALLGLSAAASVFAINNASMRSDRAIAAARSAQEALAAEQQKHDAENRRFQQSSSGQTELETFLGDWSLYAEEGNALGDVVDRLSKLAYDRNLITTRRPTPLRGDYPLGADTASVQVVGFSVSGNYESVIDWLGAVERTFPFGRIESAALRGRASDVELEIQLTFFLGINTATRPTRR